MRQAIIVLGAGASHDCASGNVFTDPAFTPPLVTGLFEQRYASILHAYPLAEQIAPDIRLATRTGQEVGLESFLRDELLKSPHDHLRRRFHAVPLYLQHLLFEVSAKYTQHPDNYDRLITEALRLDKVTFITLNYDTLLDQRLAIDAPIEGMRDYLHARRNWALVKLHGSVNWGRQLLNQDDEPTEYRGVGMPRSHPPRTFANYYASLGEHIEVDREIVLRPQESLEDTRVEWIAPDGQVSGRHYGELYYPALAVPLGAADEMVCPDDHVEYVRDHQRHVPGGLNLLVLGYSGVDEEARKLLAWGGRPLSSLLVVNGSLDASRAAAEVLAHELGAEATADMAFAGGFTDFAQSNALADYLRGLPDTGS